MIFQSARLLVLLALIGLLGSCSNSDNSNEPATEAPPNIIFFILDDVGIDQMQSFGYGGASPPQLPNITAIANAGVSFRNMWAMPECSPSRALVFEGRYPFRTNVTNAILSVDLANSQVSPYESTTPKILRERGYSSALFGKFHLTGSNINQTGMENNPLNWTAVHQLGWDFFKGWQDGSPFPIDTTAGGVAESDTGYTCGFIPDRASSPGGSDAGACYAVDNTCEEISTTVGAPTPGRTCLERGGIFVPDKLCSLESPPPQLDFTLQNGYYVGELVVNQPDGSFEVYPPQDPSGAARGYRSVLESDWAIDWINSQSNTAPWMATVSYSSAHSPFQQAPTSLLAPGAEQTAGFDCTDIKDQRVISNQMIEGMDTQIGRVLAESGIATITNGVLEFSPEHTNTMIVLLGDNGTYAPAVKAPFNPVRSKGTVYQTGVWTPLIVAGSLVREPGREVTAMVNIADVFQLFGEIAGIDVHAVVPASRPLDSASLLPYLEDPAQPPIRQTNFAQTATNIKPEGYEVPPCVLELSESVDICLQLFPSQTLCNSEGGTWWGEPDGSSPSGLGEGPPQTSCCGVNQYLTANDQQPYGVLPDAQMAIRDANFKLVKYTSTNWDTTSSSCNTQEYTEFYRIDESNNNPKLDNSNDNLLAADHTLDPVEDDALQSLTIALNELLETNTTCSGDGNRDGVVNAVDIEQLEYWQDLTGFSSWYDFDLNGKTNAADLTYITEGTLPRDCP